MPIEIDPVLHGQKVTIAIACYNQGRFLSEAIESALNQTHPGAEIIVVDDGSTDDTAAVARRFPEVRIISQRNAGLSAARNTGTRESSGDYIIFLDADDRLRPNTVAAGLACFSRHPGCAFVSGEHVRIRADGTFLSEHDPSPPHEDPYVRLLRGNYIGMHATVMYKREALLSLGGFDTTLPACEDYDVYLRLANDHDVGSHDLVIAEYRIHGENMSRDPGFMLNAVLRVLRQQQEAVRDDPERRAAFSDGLSIWNNYYGEILFDQFRSAIRTRSSSRDILQTGYALARHAPHKLVHAGQRTLRRTAGRARRAAGRALRSVMAGSRPSEIHGDTPPIGKVDFGDLRRTEPISREFGFDRGQPVDRYYIEKFLARHADDVHGRTLEIGDDSYTRRFGGDRVEQADVLHAHGNNPLATFVADLTKADHVPSNTFDCIVLTQTLQFIFDVDAAITTLHRILKPGGVLLATVPGISQIEQGEWGSTWFWSFTPLSARRLFAKHFEDEYLSVHAHGNVLAAIAFLQGVAAEELSRDELDAEDALYPMLITIRVQKHHATA